MRDDDNVLTAVAAAARAHGGAAPGATEGRISLARILSLLIVLAVESGVLVARVPAASWKAWGERASPDSVGLATLVALCAAASVLASVGLWGERLVALLNQPSSRAASVPRLWFALHVACFAGLCLVFDAFVTTMPALPLQAASVALATAGLFSLALVLLPGRVWLHVARLVAIPLLLSVVVGAVAHYISTGAPRLWEWMIRSTLSVVHGLLHLVAPAVHADPASFSIGVASFNLVISAPCSGYEGIGLIWAFLATYLWFFRRALRFPHALLLVPLGTAVVWLANAVRIALFVLIGAYWSPEVALGGFHSTAGSVMFMGVGLGLILAGDRLAFFRSDGAARAPGTSAAAPYLVPFMVLIGLSLIGRMLAADFDVFYPARVVGVALALAWFARDYAHEERAWSWAPPALGVLAYAVWIGLEPTSSSAWLTARHMPVGLQTLPWHWYWLWIAARLIGSIIAVPIAEELAFRGFLIRRLQAADFARVSPARFTWLSFLASSVLFGLLHGRWLAASLAGMLYALALYRRGRLSDAIIAHATTNACIAVQVLAADGWPLWQ